MTLRWFRLNVSAVLVFLIILLCHVNYSEENIHRAVPGTIPSNILRTQKVSKNNGIIIEESDEEDEVGFLERLNSKASGSWLWAILASIIVGSTGVFPLLIFKVEDGHSLKEAISSNHLKLLLSFAVGGLIGDVFLHLLPEAWMYSKNTNGHDGDMKIGLWIIAGLLSFMTIEKIFMEEEKCREIVEEQASKDLAKEIDSLTKITQNGSAKNGIKNGAVANGNVHKDGVTNGVMRHRQTSKDIKEEKREENFEERPARYTENEIKVIGYLNLFANCSDNFTHGLAVAGSFLVSTPVGVCTTFAILLHEIPHEIGDFAILLKAGFKRWEAAKGQMITASGALIGCLFGLLAESAGDASSWVLPYTSGGFIYISLVTLVPDLLKEDDFRESLKQIACLLLGISCMGCVSLFHH